MKVSSEADHCRHLVPAFDAPLILVLLAEELNLVVEFRYRFENPIGKPHNEAVLSQSSISAYMISTVRRMKTTRRKGSTNKFKKVDLKTAKIIAISCSMIAEENIKPME